MSLSRREDGTFAAAVGDTNWTATHVILATGVVDVEPPCRTPSRPCGAVSYANAQSATPTR
jgi:hypothetical protein